MHYRMLLAILIHASPMLIHARPIFIDWLGFPFHILIHALTILIHWVGFRLSALYLNTLNRHDSSRQPIRIENYVTRVVRIEQYLTRELSARAEDPSRLSARYSLFWYIGSSTPLWSTHTLTTAVWFWTNTERWRSHLFFSLALRWAVLQAAKWLFRNASAKMGNQMW